MLPSCGHFKNIPCPFYKRALCDRPHCPYKHLNSENDFQRQLFAPLVDEAESLLDSNLNNSSAYHDTASEVPKSFTYVPTPVDASSKPLGILKTCSNLEKPSTSYVPEYKPTPISKLKEISSVPNVKSSKSQYCPEYPVGVKRKKNVEEYDPTEVKFVLKKSVTFVDQSDGPSDDAPIISLSSDEDIGDDSESAPKFSDDEYEPPLPVTNASKQVPESTAIKEEKIDEFSVVDKILVDCKKNEQLLNSLKKVNLSTKANNLSSKVTTLKKHNNKSTSNKTSDIKSCKSDDNNSVKLKKTDNNKKEVKTDKSESSEKIKKSISHSSSEKDKDSSSKQGDKSKHSKKISQEGKKYSSSESKISKSNNHLGAESSDKIKSKKGTDNHNNIEGSPKRKKSKSETSNLKSSETNIKFKDKTSSDIHSVKKKSDTSSFKSEYQSKKNKSSSDGKKRKSESNISPKKRRNSADSSASDGTKPINANSDSDIDATLLKDLVSSSESDPEEECRQIFNECYPENSESPTEQDKEESSLPKSSKTPELVILRKKRFAHPAASELKPPTKQAKAEIKKHLNPAQVMHNRIAQYQAAFAQMNANKDIGKGTDKKRINFAPSQNLLAAVKNKNEGNPALSNFSPLPATVSKSLKVANRTAHIPETAMKPRPMIPAEYGCKVPANIRQKYLNAFIEECLKFCPSETEAYDLALEEEKAVYSRSSSRPLYLNVAANALKRLRRRVEEGPESTGNNSVSSKTIPVKSDQKRMVSHEAVLNGPLAQRRSFSIGRKKEVPEIRGGAALYEYLLTYVLTPEQLIENSYPLPHPIEKDRAVISGVYANRTLYCNDAFKRTCTRCHKTYYVNVDGDYVRDEECDFHWGRIWKKRIAGSFESRYSCCQGDAESDGCCVSPGHVFDGSEAHVLKGYVKTLPKTPPPDNCYGIYALDCEMCYTTAGMELTRITVVDTDLKPVYESFVKPQHKVLDYNTRFSGITEDDLKNVRTTIHDVQAVLLCIFNNKTILIGHSLESDFKALKLFHSTVIDTSVVFPHKSGLPFKRALRTLMAENLNKIIQNDVGGHDSNEDAVACMELMLWKVKEDVRSNR